MTTSPVPICFSCAYLHEDTPLMVCDAYPYGIPEAIIDSEVDHRLPYTGDNGIRFAQRDDRLPIDPLVFEGEP